MSHLSDEALKLIGAALLGDTAVDVGRRFHGALSPFGVTASYVRSHAGSGGREHIYSRVSPPGWEDYYRQQRFGEVNYLRREAQRRSAPFWWSDIELDDPQELRLARALPENGFVRGLATPCHGAHGYLAVVSLGFERQDTVSPEERAAIELASLVVHQRMRSLSEPAPKTTPRLTVREYDCLSFVAEGRTNGEIAERLGLSETTVITHLKNTRYKLGVANRAQAVARAYELNLLGSGRMGLGRTRR